jgi:hypothetical protein
MEGATNGEIAAQLEVSVATVERRLVMIRLFVGGRTVRRRGHCSATHSVGVS